MDTAERPEAGLRCRHDEHAPPPGGEQRPDAVRDLGRLSIELARERVVLGVPDDVDRCQRSGASRRVAGAEVLHAAGGERLLEHLALQCASLRVARREVRSMGPRAPRPRYTDAQVDALLDELKGDR